VEQITLPMPLGPPVAVTATVCGRVLQPPWYSASAKLTTGTVASTSKTREAVPVSGPFASPLVAEHEMLLEPVAAVGMLHMDVPAPEDEPETSDAATLLPLSVQPTEAIPDGPATTSNCSVVLADHPAGAFGHDTLGVVSSTWIAFE
jgi:hypothetical protein